MTKYRELWRRNRGEVLRLVEAHQLAGSGLGWIDVHLLASARVSGARLWPADGALQRGCGDAAASHNHSRVSSAMSAASAAGKSS
jgi:hypothetical protein